VTAVDEPLDRVTSAPAIDVEDPALNTTFPGEVADTPVRRLREPDVPALLAPVERYILPDDGEVDVDNVIDPLVVVDETPDVTRTAPPSIVVLLPAVNVKELPNAPVDSPTDNVNTPAVTESPVDIATDPLDVLPEPEYMLTLPDAEVVPTPENTWIFPEIAESDVDIDAVPLDSVEPEPDFKAIAPPVEEVLPPAVIETDPPVDDVLEPLVTEILPPIPVLPAPPITDTSPPFTFPSPVVNEKAPPLPILPEPLVTVIEPPTRPLPLLTATVPP